MSVEFGWTRFRLDLRDAEIKGYVELQENDEEYGWTPRERPIIFSDELKEGEIHPDIRKFEEQDKIRFSKLKRLIVAKGYTFSFMDAIYLGDAEDNERLSLLDISIHSSESPEEEHKDLLKYGTAGHTESYEGEPEKNWLQLYIPDSSFDDIEKAIHNGFQEFELQLNMKCFHDDSIAGTEIYIPKERTDKDHRIRAEMSSIFFSKKFATPIPGGADLEEDYASEYQPTLDQQLLSQIASSLNSMKGVIGLSTLALVILVIITVL